MLTEPGAGWAEVSRIAQVAAQHSWHFCLTPECTKTQGFSHPAFFFSSGLQNSHESQGWSNRGGHLIITICELAFLLREQVISTPNIALLKTLYLCPQNG